MYKIDNYAMALIIQHIQRHINTFLKELFRMLLIIINPFEYNSESLEQTRYLIYIVYPNQAFFDMCLETL